MSLSCGAVVRFVIVTFPIHTHLFSDNGATLGESTF